MTEHKPHRRKKYFIDKSYQTKFILKFSALILAGAVISTVLLLLFSQDTLTSSFVNSRLEVKSTSAAILPAIVLTNIITVTIVTIATVVVVLFISHKIAGPMHRFEKEIQNIGKGDISRNIALREEDQFEKVAQSLDGMVSSLRGKITTIRNAVDQALVKIEADDIDKDGLISELQHSLSLIDSTFKRQ